MIPAKPLMPIQAPRTMFPPTDDPTLFSCGVGGCSGDCDCDCDNNVIDSVDAVLEPTTSVVVIWTMSGVVVGMTSDLAVAISTEEEDTKTKANNKLAKLDRTAYQLSFWAFPCRSDEGSCLIIVTSPPSPCPSPSRWLRSTKDKSSCFFPCIELREFPFPFRPCGIRHTKVGGCSCLKQLAVDNDVWCCNPNAFTTCIGEKANKGATTNALERRAARLIFFFFMVSIVSSAFISFLLRSVA